MLNWLEKFPFLSNSGEAAWLLESYSLPGQRLAQFLVAGPIRSKWMLLLVGLLVSALGSFRFFACRAAR